MERPEPGSPLYELEQRHQQELDYWRRWVCQLQDEARGRTDRTLEVMGSGFLGALVGASFDREYGAAGALLGALAYALLRLGQYLWKRRKKTP